MPARVDRQPHVRDRAGDAEAASRRCRRGSSRVFASSPSAGAVGPVGGVADVGRDACRADRHRAARRRRALSRCSTGRTALPNASSAAFQLRCRAERLVFVPLGLRERSPAAASSCPATLGLGGRFAEDRKAPRRCPLQAGEVLASGVGERVPGRARLAPRPPRAVDRPPRLRCGSYISSTLACANASAEPTLSLTVQENGCDGLPSILIGRPSKLVTSRPGRDAAQFPDRGVLLGHARHAVARVAGVGGELLLGQRRQPVSVSARQRHRRAHELQEAAARRGRDRRRRRSRGTPCRSAPALRACRPAAPGSASTRCR